LNSHRLIFLASKKKINLGKLIESLFVAFFVEEKDTGNVEILSTIAQKNGLNSLEV